MEVLAGIAILAAAIIGLRTIWQKGALPVGRGIRRIVHALDVLDDALPVWIEIADEFRPNGRPSLRCQIDTLSEGQAALTIGQHNMQQQLEHHIERCENCG